MKGPKRAGQAKLSRGSNFGSYRFDGIEIAHDSKDLQRGVHKHAQRKNTCQRLSFLVGEGRPLPDTSQSTNKAGRRLGRHTSPLALRIARETI